jgi:multiple sugar transport system substrate-binding protein
VPPSLVTEIRLRSCRTAFSGPLSYPAAEAFSKYIVVDMYAKAIQGLPPEESVKWAAGELTKVYA